MISRMFTVVEGNGNRREYKGFDQKFGPVNLDQVALILTEGEIDVYAVDDHPKARSEFVRFLNDEVEAGHPEPLLLGMYKRT